jgi:hypothetical protein
MPIDKSESDPPVVFAQGGKYADEKRATPPKDERVFTAS